MFEWRCSKGLILFFFSHFKLFVSMTLSISTTGIILLTLTSIYILILTPINLYYAYKIYKYCQQNIPFFTKRHPKLIIYSCILFNIYPCIIKPFSDFSRDYGFEWFDNDHPFPRTLTNLVQWYILLEYMRLWLLYYDYTYGLQTAELQWSRKILKEQTPTPWTHKYKFLGNVKILTLIASSLALIFISLIIIGDIFLESLFVYLQAVPMICTLFMFYIAFKVRRCRDVFSIQSMYVNVTRLAIQKQFICICIYIINEYVEEFRIYGVLLIFLIIAYIVIQTLTDSETPLRKIIMNLFTCSCCYVLGYVSTYWVVKQYEREMVRRRSLDEERESQTLSDIRSSMSKRWELEDILATKDGFDLFANHLVKEFSIENLYFIFEMVQIKSDLIDHKFGCILFVSFIYFIDSMCVYTNTPKFDVDSLNLCCCLRKPGWFRKRKLEY